MPFAPPDSRPSDAAPAPFAEFITTSRAAADAEAAERAVWIAQELKDALARRLLEGGGVAAVGNVIPAALVTVLVWSDLPPERVLVWMGAVVVGAVLRWLVPPVASRGASGLHGGVRAVRVTTTLLALAWGLGAAFAIPVLPPETSGLVLAVLVGLMGGASHLQVADRVSANLYATALFGIPAVAMLLTGPGRHHLATVVLMALFAGMLWRLFGLGRRALVSQLTAVKALEYSERRLAREHRFLNALLGSAPVAIATVERADRVTGVNPQFERLFGYAAAEAIGRDMNDLIVPEQAREDARAMQAVAHGGRGVVREAERRRKDGRSIPVRISAAAVAGDPDGTLFVLYEDFSTVKRVEAALREAEAQYRTIVESASDLVFQIDAEGRWSFVNLAAKEIYGAEPEGLLGRPFAERALAGHAAADQAAFARVMAGERIDDYETVHAGPQGLGRTLSISAFPARDADGRVSGAIGIARDVSGAVRLRLALQQARDVAERATVAKAAFLANMSHEIRTPLNGILGMIEILLDTELTDAQRRSAELVRTSGEALLEILNDVLDYSKIEAGHVQIETVAFDLPGVVHSVAGLLGARAFEKGIELVADIAPQLPAQVRGDPGRLRQVLINLVGNAVKFTPAGEVVLRVALLGIADGRAELEFAVRDTGIGIPADKLQSVFEEFEQADVSTTRRFGGTGLGLSISRRLVRLMGGELSLASVEGRGTTFRFVLTLPIESGEPSVAHSLSSDVLAGSLVLIVDDNATNRQVIRRFLEDARAVVTDCAGAAEALALLRSAAAAGGHFRLAVIDGYMPDTDGFQLAAEIRADPKLAATPLMMLTSAGQRGDGERCRKLGITGYLTKPVPRMELLEAAIAVLAGGASSGRLVTRHLIEESRKRLRILVAEDNVVNQQVARALLLKRGHDVEIVANGREAVEAVRQRPFDVVLMDVQMPELDGLAATAQIRAMPGFEKLPIVAVTAHALQDERERFLAAGMSGVVTKPFKPHQLFAAVEGWDAPSEVPVAKPAVPEAGVAPEAVTAPVDLVALRASLREGGVEELVAPLIASFLKDAPARADGVDAALRSGDAERLRQAAHAYKSSAAQLGARALAADLQAVESAAHEGDLAAAGAAAVRMRAEHDRVMAYLAGSVGRELHGA